MSDHWIMVGSPKDATADIVVEDTKEPITDLQMADAFVHPTLEYYPELKRQYAWIISFRYMRGLMKDYPQAVFKAIEYLKAEHNV